MLSNLPVLAHCDPRINSYSSLTITMKERTSLVHKSCFVKYLYFLTATIYKKWLVVIDLCSTISRMGWHWEVLFYYTARLVVGPEHCFF
jgi:hypothetical protein